MQQSDSNQPFTPHISVIGAGLAGLTAAYRLQQAGYVVNVYEGRERSGGRVYTAYLRDHYAELGGERLEDGEDSGRIRALIKEMGLTVETGYKDNTYSYSVLFNNEVKDSADLILSIPADQLLWNRLLYLANHSANLGEVLDQLCQSKNSILRRFFERQMQSHEGSDTQFLSTFYITSFFKFLRNYQERARAQKQKKHVVYYTSHVKGGNSKLIEELTHKLRKKIQYQSVLTKIYKNPNGSLVLDFGTNKQVLTDCVVLAMPLSTLRDVIIEDSIFPADQIKAIKSLQYGSNTKILVPIQLSTPPTPLLFSTETFMSWFNHDYSILTLFYGGKFSLFPCQTQDEINNQLLKNMPDLLSSYPTAHFPTNITPIGINWMEEKFSKGSYSNLGINQEKIFQECIEIKGEIIKKVFRPINKQIFFAGEHTSIDHPATLEGAVESGEKTYRLIQSLRPINKNHT